MSILELTEDLNFDQLNRKLAVESFSSPEVFAIFRNLIPKSAELITDFVATFRKTTAEAHASGLSSALHQEVVNAARDYNFLAFNQTVIMVPEGFDGHFIPYLKYLIALTKHEITSGVKVVSDYNVLLSAFLSNADVRKSLKDQTSFYRNLANDRAREQKAIETFFSKKTPTLSRRPLGSVIERFSDLDATFKLAEELSNLRTNVPYKEALAKVNETVQLLDLIKERITSGDVSDVSAVVAKNISEGAFEVGKFIEAFSIHSYHVETVLVSVNELARQLKELLKK